MHSVKDAQCPEESRQQNACNYDSETDTRIERRNTAELTASGKRSDKRRPIRAVGNKSSVNGILIVLIFIAVVRLSVLTVFIGDYHCRVVDHSYRALKLAKHTGKQRVVKVRIVAYQHRADTASRKGGDKTAESVVGGVCYKQFKRYLAVNGNIHYGRSAILGKRAVIGIDRTGNAVERHKALTADDIFAVCRFCGNASVADAQYLGVRFRLSSVCRTALRRASECPGKSAAYLVKHCGSALKDSEYIARRHSAAKTYALYHQRARSENIILTEYDRVGRGVIFRLRFIQKHLGGLQNVLCQIAERIYQRRHCKDRHCDKHHYGKGVGCGNKAASCCKRDQEYDQRQCHDRSYNIIERLERGIFAVCAAEIIFCKAAAAQSHCGLD